MSEYKPSKQSLLRDENKTLRGKRVAIVYPGGRTELGCAYEGRKND